jgi:broad specificity phosphatase PhoE
MAKIQPKWPKRLTIVRHGQSEQNITPDLFDADLVQYLERLRKIRDADIALTEIGVWQAEKTGEHLAKQPKFDICFSSPYMRTLQTAGGIVSKIGYDLKVYKDNRLREKEFGRLHALTTEMIQEKYPDEYFDRKRDGKYWYRLLGGENYPDVEMRVHSFLDKLVRDYGGKSVLVVTHHVPYVLFRALFEHLCEQEVLNLGDVANCGIEEFVLDQSKKPEGRIVLKEFNKVAYDIAKAPRKN